MATTRQVIIMFLIMFLMLLIKLLLVILLIMWLLVLLLIARRSYLIESGDYLGLQSAAVLARASG